MTIPLQVLVSVGWLSVHLEDKELSANGVTKGIKEWNGSICLSPFCELNCWVHAIDVVQEFLFMCLFLDDPCIIHKPIPCPGGLIAELRAFLSKHSMYRLATMGLTQ